RRDAVRAGGGEPRGPQRRRRRGAVLPGRARLQRAVPPGGRAGPARRARPVRPVLRADGPDATALRRPPHRRGGAVMPMGEDVRSVLVIGSGPIVIGQACEFDYSGTQACRVLRAEGMRVVLVNSNPATIMTDPELADATYVEPITPDIVTKIIERERPDALPATMGGRTAR